jgi:hypothetical protein
VTIKRSRSGRVGLIGAATFSLGLVIGGCGEGPKPAASAPAPAAGTTDAGSASKSLKITSGPGGKMSKDADLSAREKRNLRKGIKPPE